MDTYVLFALYTLAASVLTGLLFKYLWRRSHHRAIQRKWTERERLLDRPRPHAAKHEILERRSRAAGTRDQDPPRPAPIVTPEPFARLLFIVARDQRELVGFLHKDFAAEEAEGVIEIFSDRRQSPRRPGARPRHADGWRRDPDRNRTITTNLREIGWAVARQPAPLPETALSR